MNVAMRPLHPRWTRTTHALACAFACAAACAAVIAPSASAASASERPPLAIDRSDVSQSTAMWDENQGALRQTRRHAGAAFAGRPTELLHPTPAADDNCGWEVGVGDVNGDGLADVAVGCPGDDTTASNAGTVVVHLRNAANTGYDAGLEYQHPSPAADDACGEDVAIADVNGDGRGDLVIGCPTDDIGFGDQGSVIVRTRNAANNGFDAGVVIAHPSPAANDECGDAVAAGDVNGDGRADVAMGCRLDNVGATSDAGSVVVVTRDLANTGFTGAVAVTRSTMTAADSCGNSVAIADVNADGRGDLVVGCFLQDPGFAEGGSMFVAMRDAANTGFDAGVNLFHPSPAVDDNCGYSVAGGDLNADGRADVVMGCTLRDAGAADSGAAIAFLRNAANNGFDPAIGLVHPSPTASMSCGYSTSIADVDGDGRGDVLAGCHFDDAGATDSGSAIAFLRDEENSGFLAGSVQAPPSPANNDQCGHSLEAGDTDGDGRADVVMGCRYDATGAATAGSAVVVDGAGGTATALQHPAAAASDTCGRPVVSGDVNGDGLADVAMGCFGDDTGGLDAGSMVVFTRSGNDGGFSTGVELNHPAAQAGDECGWSGAIGDVNGDGRDDIVMGCTGDDTGGSSAGSAVVFTRNVSNTGFDAGVELGHPVPTGGDNCGYSVAVGDVNGDGRDDVLIGCRNDDTGGSAAGSVVVLLRNSTNDGFDAGTEFGHPSPAAGDSCGYSVAAGDVNADGHEDIALGCRDDDTGGAEAGSVVVLTRDATNTTFDTGIEYGHPGAAGGDNCGRSIAVGDVDGDGRGDIAFGCYGDDTGGSAAGSVVVRTRNAANTGFDAGEELGHPVPAANDECGGALAIGDVNGDGRDDVAIGCAYDDTGASSAGSVVIRTRNSTNDGFDAGITLGHPTPAASDLCGYSITLGDIHGDGRSDAIMSCYYDDLPGPINDAGSIHVFSSTATGVAGSIGTPAESVELVPAAPNTSDTCGYDVASGDLNGDGRDDVVISCHYADDGANNTGGAIAFLRNAANTGFEAGVELWNPNPAVDDNCGFGVAAGDVNADGRDDVLIGCKGNDAGATDAGSVLVFTRDQANTGFDAGIELVNPSPANLDQCGRSVAAGDVNGDGRADIAIGCWQQNGTTNRGSVVVFARNAANNGFAAGVEMLNNFPADGDFCGTDVAIGDVDADGLEDVAMGCINNDDGATNAGSVITFVSNGGTPVTFDAGVEVDNPAPGNGDFCGRSVVLEDIDGDRRADVLMGCYSNDAGAADAGSLAVFTSNGGAPVSFTSAGELLSPAPAASDGCGISVSAGDINDDGRTDLAMGCWLSDAGTANGGSIVAFLRNEAGTGFETGVELVDDGNLGGDNCGMGSAIGDVDGDGRGDLMNGCAGNDAVVSGAGAVAVFADRSTRVVSRKLNLRGGTVYDVTVNLARVANGAEAPTVEASPDGGSTWEAVTVGANHVFGASGKDLRLRVRMPHAPTSRMTQVVHDLTVDYTYNEPPNAPALVTPADAASTPDTTPDLVATFADDDAPDTGQLAFEVCTVAPTPAQTCAGAGGTLLASGSTVAGIANGANGTWTVSPAIAPQVVHWRARGTDSDANVGAWSASRQLTIQETISIGVDSATAAIGGIVAGSDATATTVVTIDSNDPQGYTLSATDESDTWGADCACGAQLPDWTGTGATPTAWAALTSGYFGVTVLDTTGLSTNRLGKWGTANPAGWPATDFTNNLFAGLDNGSSSVLHDTIAPTVASDTITVAYRVNAGASQQAGTYDASITFTATGKP